MWGAPAWRGATGYEDTSCIRHVSAVDALLVANPLAARSVWEGGSHTTLWRVIVERPPSGGSQRIVHRSGALRCKHAVNERAGLWQRAGATPPTFRTRRQRPLTSSGKKCDGLANRILGLALMEINPVLGRLASPLSFALVARSKESSEACLKHPAYAARVIRGLERRAGRKEDTEWLPIADSRCMPGQINRHPVNARYPHAFWPCGEGWAAVETDPCHHALRRAGAWPFGIPLGLRSSN